MRGVIVLLNENGVTVAVVAADMAPAERAPADEDREQRGDTAAKETIAGDAKPHPPGL